MYYYTYDVLVTEKWCLGHNVKWPVFHCRLIKASYLVNNRGHGHKNTVPFRYLVTSATDYLSSVISFSNCDNKTVDYILVNPKATNMTADIGNSILGTDITSETA